MASIANQTSLYDHTHAANSKCFDHTHGAIPAKLAREEVRSDPLLQILHAMGMHNFSVAIATETSLYDHTHAANSKCFDHTHGAIPIEIVREEMMKKDSKDSVSATASTASTEEVGERDIERGDVPNSSVFGCW